MRTSSGRFLPPLIAVAVVGACLASPYPAAAIQTTNVRAYANAGDDSVIATVHVATSGNRKCKGRLRHAGLSASLPPVKTHRSGGARWQWAVARDVPGGTWRVKVTCYLPDEKSIKRTSFTAANGRRTGEAPARLVRNGTMRVEPWEIDKVNSGVGGGGKNGYPEGQCTWWVKRLRQDLPTFLGPSGDAKNWAASARRAGFRVGAKAKPGAVVVFQPGQAGAGEHGHVAYVESVDGPEMTISEANFAGTKPGNERTIRWRGRHFEFIYKKGALPSDTSKPVPGSHRSFVFRTCLNGRCGLTARVGPGARFRTFGRRLPEGAPVDIVCQIRGERVEGIDASSTNVWDRLVDGSYVSDYFVKTPGKGDQFSEPIPNCSQLTDQQVVPPELPPSYFISLLSPSTGSTLTGPVEVTAMSNAPAVRFEAFYSPMPGEEGMAAWHQLGTDSSPADGFELSWNTATIPNQGLGTEITIQVVAVALDSTGAPATTSPTRQVAVANPNLDGTYSYYVDRTCEADCKLKRRSGPGFSEYPVVGTTPEGGEVRIACQAHGQLVGGAEGSSDIWNEFDDGSWGSDYYVTTPRIGVFSPPIPECESTPPPPTFSVKLETPGSGQTVTGTIDVKATSDAPAVRFEAYWSPVPGTQTPTWHSLGKDTSPGDGFGVSWNTATVPNQGQPVQNTVQVRATALNFKEENTAAQAARRVSVSNPSGDGSYAYHVFGTCPGGDCTVNVHSGPGYSSYPTVGTKEEGDEVKIVCQAHGETVSATWTTDIWNKLADGTWITDYYVDTPVAGDFSPPIPVCP